MLIVHQHTLSLVHTGEDVTKITLEIVAKFEEMGRSRAVLVSLSVAYTRRAQTGVTKHQQGHVLSEKIREFK